ncbi:MAG: hypothetical protein AVDCRST_MAG28-2107, partial [uncultured Rubrobacteraceae bacterium]
DLAGRGAPRQGEHGHHLHVRSRRATRPTDTVGHRPVHRGVRYASVRRTPRRSRPYGNRRPNRALRQRAILPTLPRLRLHPAQDSRGVSVQPARGSTPYRAADSVCERINEEYAARAIHGFERLVVDLL